MNPDRLSLALVLLVGALPSLLVAQEVSPTAKNVLWPNPPNFDLATPGQFGGFLPITSSPPTGQGGTVPTSATYRLEVSLFGASIAGSPPEVSLGDVIGMPIATFNNAQNVPVKLRREPIRKGEALFKFVTSDDPTIRDFDPNTAILSERFFWSPHARLTTLNDGAGVYEIPVVKNTPGGIEHDGFVYASQAGATRLYWRTADPIGVDGASNAIYGLVERVVNVSSATDLTVRRIFWTEHGFQGQPVTVPRGEIQEVRIAYNDAVPVEIEGEDEDPNLGEIPETRRTIWHDRTLNSLHAYNREGRVLIEFLGELRAGGPGLRRQIGIEIVDIIQEALPVPVRVPVGDRLYPLPPEQNSQQAYPLPPRGNARDIQLARIEDLLAEYGPQPILNAAANPPFTQSFTIDGVLYYYATRTTNSASDVQVFWTEPGLADIRWPKFLNIYDQRWPEELTEYAVNVRPSDSAQTPTTPPLFGEGSVFQLIYQDNNRAQAGNTASFVVDLSDGTLTNRSLLLITAGDHFWFQRVESVLDSAMPGNPRYAGFYRDKMPDPNDPATNPPVELTAEAGKRLLPPAGAGSVAGYVDLTQGDAIDPTAYVDPFSAGIPEAESTGAIIPVNAAEKKGGSGKTNNRLGVWWFRKVNPPGQLAGRIPPVYWPSYYSRYQLTWPTNAPQIVLASNEGSPDLNADAASGKIYYENDPTQVGYNPNEEHAQLIAGRAYALRDDLNHSNVSSPYVLVRFTNAVDGRPDMKVFRVLRENETHTFTYNARAGAILNAPMPLAVMPPPLRPDGTSRNVETTPNNLDPPNGDFASHPHYGSFTYEDRKGLKWIYRGQHMPSGSPPPLTMKFYYATREGFAYPNAVTGADDPPPLGTLTPYLREQAVDGNYIGDPKQGNANADGTGDALTISFRPYWPDRFPDDPREVPALQFAETLVKPKFGLPGLDGASSAFILYQQSIAEDMSTAQKSAVLHDPTRRKVYLLDSLLPELPSSILTDRSGVRLTFQGLAAHLQSRFFLDSSIGSGNPPKGGLVLEGEFHDEPLGEDYIDLNVLSSDDLDAIKALPTNNDPRRSGWITAVSNLTTTLETFVEDANVPGTYIVNPSASVAFNQNQFVEVTHRDQAVDSYALTGVGGGDGYVTLLLGDGEAFTDASEPVQMHILRVGPDLYRGQLKPIAAANPLAEDLTIQHTGDFAGQASDFEFQWYYSPPVNGQPPLDRPDDPGSSWFEKVNEEEPRVTLGGDQPLLALTDNYYIMRYRPKAGHVLRENVNWGPNDGWSAWTDPALAEGWIKRVLAGINPFNQRVSDFFNNPVNTDVSLLTSAGERWEGSVPLTLDSVQDASLISIYETVLRRGMSFTIEGNPPINYGPANDALLLASGYLNDLYMALGNEAFADASNPLISLDVDASRLLLTQGLPSSIGTTIETTASARFAFEGQVPTLLDEELVLLRGRDDFLVPGTRTAPIYNRFVWNFTRGIDAGEVIYALNYNITEKADADADGKIDAADARRQYPQGHGDAYGHYLTGVKNYYRLLANAAFTWTPRVEAVNILGTPVTVDYQDERKFAAAAVALGRTASRILDLERRKLPSGTGNGWKKFRETKSNNQTENARTWGVEQWAARAGQGNFLHWTAVNALLPEVDEINEGLQKIDRTAVPELDELASLGAQLQSHMDGANRRVNALDLSDDSILFDLSPAELESGESHFDQILARAKGALANVATAHERTIRQNALLRSVENQAADYSFTVDREEFALVNRLYDIYGIPYSGDVGPGKIYPQGYEGPDFVRYMYINRPYVYNREQVFGTTPEENFRKTFVLPVLSTKFLNLISGFDGQTGYANEIRDVYRQNYVETDGAFQLSYTVNLNEGPYQIATPQMGQRLFIGSIQLALAEVMRVREDMFLQARGMNAARERFAVKLQRLAEDIDALNQIKENNYGIATSKLVLNKVAATWELVDDLLGSQAKSAQAIFDSARNSLPTVSGPLAYDTTSVARGSLLASAALAERALDVQKIVKKSVFFATSLLQDLAEFSVNIANTELNNSVTIRGRVTDLEAAYRELFGTIRDIDLNAQALDAALAAYQNEIINGETILFERETFRKRAAAVIQGARTRDVAFRAFRTESLEQYKILFDQAARYTFLAAKAYDYETGQLGTDAGRKFLAGIVSSRALGLVGEDGEPQFGGGNAGDPGLSSYLARLKADWNVAKGRLGINNPDEDGTLFSLRRELFNLPFFEDGSHPDHTVWQDRLRAALVTDLRSDPAIAAHALPTANASGLAQPGFVFDFSGAIEPGLNFFGNPLAPGDNAFSTASFSTKIYSVGVAFQGYIGMNSYASGSSAMPPPLLHPSPDALSATPYVYLIPAGMDRMRTPPLGGSESSVRNWLVHDHAMPLPYDIGGGGFGEDTTWNSSTSLTERFFIPRKHQPFRAVDDPSHFYGTVPADFTNHRLVGRSVWNTRWKLVIPAGTLLADPEEGIERFMRSVEDIKLFVRTYSHAGN